MARLGLAGLLRDLGDDLDVVLRGLGEDRVDLVDVPVVPGLEDDRVAVLQLVDVVELGAVAVAMGGEGEVAVLAGHGERGLDRVGVVAGHAVVEDVRARALLDQHHTVLHRRHVQEADAVLGVQRARPGVLLLRPVVADLFCLFVRLAIRYHVRPPQGVDDEEREQQAHGDEDFTEDTDRRRDPARAPTARHRLRLGRVRVFFGVVGGRCHCLPLPLCDEPYSMSASGLPSLRGRSWTILPQTINRYVLVNSGVQVVSVM